MRECSDYCSLQADSKVKFAAWPTSWRPPGVDRLSSRWPKVNSSIWLAPYRQHYKHRLGYYDVVLLWEIGKRWVLRWLLNARDLVLCSNANWGLYRWAWIVDSERSPFKLKFSWMHRTTRSPCTARYTVARDIGTSPRIAQSTKCLVHHQN